MPLATLYALSAQQLTGSLVLATPLDTGGGSATAFRLHIELQRGWVHGLGLDLEVASSLVPELPSTADGARRLTALLVLGLRAGLRPVAPPPPDAPPGPAHPPGARLSPFHPLGVLRAAIAELLAVAGDAGLERLDALLDASSRPRLRLRHALHPSGLDPDEQAAAQLLNAPSHWDELLLRSRCPRPRLLRLLRDAALLGALEAEAELPARLLALLVGRPPAFTPPEAVAQRRREYHAKARAVHPDLRPEADEDEREARTREMAELATRHRRGQ